MSEAKTPSRSSLPEKDVKAPNVFERVKEEFEAVLHSEKHPHHQQKETHGLRDDIDENTPISGVKAPNVFERAKEEIEAIVEAIHPKKEDLSHNSDSHGDSRGYATKADLKPQQPDSISENKGKAPNLIERAKEEIQALVHKEKSPHRHHKETHGMSEDFDENTPINEVKGPSVFERAKEEIEALVYTIHPKKEATSPSVSPSKKEGGFRVSIGKGLEKICSPHGHNKD